MNKAQLDIIDFDVSMFLDNDEVIASYLNKAMQESTEAFITALNDVARAKGMTELAKKTGLGRESLYKTLNGKTKPQLESIQKILAALNLQTQLVPISH